MSFARMGSLDGIAKLDKRVAGVEERVEGLEKRFAGEQGGEC